MFQICNLMFRSLLLYLLAACEQSTTHVSIVLTCDLTLGLGMFLVDAEICVLFL